MKKPTKKVSYRKLQSELKHAQEQTECRAAELAQMRGQMDAVYQECAQRVEQAASQIDGATKYMHRLNDEIYELTTRNHRLKCYIDTLLTALANAQSTAQSPFPKAA